jgi:hypothetical protein
MQPTFNFPVSHYDIMPVSNLFSNVYICVCVCDYENVIKSTNSIL